MIKSQETLAIGSCEKIHKRLVSVSAPVLAGRVVVLSVRHIQAQR
jgi:hypothetical protein